MQVSTFFFTPAPTTFEASHGPRELLIGELAQVGGGLPKGGWCSNGSETLDPGAGLNVEELPKGGW